MRRPQHIYITTVFITFFALYFACSFIVPAPFARDCLFGASQFLPWGILPYLAVLLPMLPVSLAAETIHTWSTHGSLSPLCDVSPQKLPHVILFTVASSLCFFLRNNTLNADALLFAGNFARDIPTLGAHLTHDEILELYVHSRFWAITHAWFDWDVTLSYQVLSALAGGVFFCVLLQHCKVLAGDQAATLFCLVASGGFIQLFFGDVENYTLTAVLLLSYFFWSALHLQGSCGPLAPSICLGVAMMFHLLSGFLLPSLAYLLYRDWRRGNRTRAATATIAVIVIPVATLTWFHLNGLPIQRLFYNSHAFGQGGNIGKVLVRPSFEYYAAILNLGLLLMPVGTLLPLGFFRKSCFRNPLVRHLAIASVTMVVYMCAWNAQLGVYEDWNLFANVALPVSILAGFCTIKAVGRHSFIVLFPLMVMWALHTGTWIVGNHHQQYYIGRTLRARIEVVGVNGDKGSVNTYFGTIKSIDGKRGIILATQAGDIRLPGNVNALTKMPRQCLCRNAGSEEADFVVTWIKRSNQW